MVAGLHATSQKITVPAIRQHTRRQPAIAFRICSMHVCTRDRTKRRFAAAASVIIDGVKYNVMTPGAKKIWHKTVLPLAAAYSHCQGLNNSD